MALSDRLAGVFEELALVWDDWTGGSSWAHCALEAPDEEMAEAAVASDGSLVTLVRLRGTLAVGSVDDRHARLVAAWSGALEDPGHAIHAVFHCDPLSAEDGARSAIAGARSAARALGFDLGGVYDEWAERLGAYTALEETWLALWTTPEALTRTARKEGEEKRRERMRAHPLPPRAMSQAGVLAPLRDPHRAFLGAVLQALSGSGYVAEALPVPEAVATVRRLVDPFRTPPEWRPRPPGTIAPRGDGRANARALGDVLPRSLREQIFARPFRECGPSVVAGGGLAHRPVVMTLPPLEDAGWWDLHAALVRTGIPFRLAFLLEGDALGGGLSFRASLARVLGFLSAENRQIVRAVEDTRRALEANVPHVRWRLVADTWIRTEGETPSREEDLRLRTQADRLVAALEGWGQARATDVTGDALLALSATLPGVTRRLPELPAACPLRTAVETLPLERPLAIWDRGSVLLRSPDGKLLPYEPMSRAQSAWVDIVSAPMGRGKSVWLNTMALGSLFRAGLDELPYVTVIDVGPSSAGLVDLLRQSLPPTRRHQAVALKVMNDGTMALNPFDLPLGCPVPTSRQVQTVVNLLMVLLSDPRAESGGRFRVREGAEGLVRRAVDLVYRELAPDAHPRPYAPGADPGVDRALGEILAGRGETLAPGESWWRIVRLLLESGREDREALAARAQRYAVPVIQDIAAAARRPEVMTLYRDVGGSGEEPLADFVARVLGAEVPQALPVLARPSTIDLSPARVIALDLDRVIDRTAGASAKRNAAMFLLAMQAGAGRFGDGPEDLLAVPAWIRPYHEARVKALREKPKRLVFDEWHRVAAMPWVVDEIVTRARESRKWNLSLALASQHPADFDAAIVELATGRWVLGLESEGAAEVLRRLWGLDGEALAAARSLPLKPGASGAHALAIIKAQVGEVRQVLVLTLGPRLLWAFSSTAEDMALRARLFRALGPARALEALARRFPGGSAREEIDARRAARREGEPEDVIETLAGEILRTLGEAA